MKPLDLYFKLNLLQVRAMLKCNSVFLLNTEAEIITVLGESTVLTNILAEPLARMWT